MGKKLEVKSGDRYGRLTVIEEVEPKIYSSGYKERRFKCQCDCGNTTIVTLKKLRNGHTSSCGCLQKQKASEANSKVNKFDLSGEIGIGYTSKGERFLFDKEDFELIKDYCWYINNNHGYVRTTDKITGKRILLHRLVMHPKKEENVDHINHDKLNNCKSNLRVCTSSNNAKNRSANKNSVSGVTGVVWKKRENKWVAQINVGGKYMHLGYFALKEEAIRARIKAELEFYKEYAPTYNYFTREQIQAILNDEMPSEEIVKILNQKGIDKQYSECYNKDR